MLSTRFIGFLLFFLQFSRYGAGLVIGDGEQAAFMPSMEGQNDNTQHLMGAAFANILGDDSDTEYNGGSVDDVILGCVDNQNITMHVGNLSVVYWEGKVKALPDIQPTVWTIRPFSSSNTKDWQIFHLTPWGKQISWRASTSEGSRVEVSADYKDEMQIKYAAGTATSPRVVVAREGRCIRFDKEGNAEIRLESYCQPFTMRIAQPAQWRDAAEKKECPSTLIHKIMKKVGDDMKDGNNVHTTTWQETLW